MKKEELKEFYKKKIEFYEKEILRTDKNTTEEKNEDKNTLEKFKKLLNEIESQ